MTAYPYDSSFVPPAPVIEMSVGHPLAAPGRTLQALLDSGADQTVVPESIVRALGLVRLDEVDVFGVGREPVRSGVYLISAKIHESTQVQLEVISWSRPYALVGRDLLNHLRIILDGPQLQLTIEGGTS